MLLQHIINTIYCAILLSMSLFFVSYHVVILEKPAEVKCDIYFNCLIQIPYYCNFLFLT